MWRSITCVMLLLCAPAGALLAETPDSVEGTWVGGLEIGSDFAFYNAVIESAEPLSGIGSVPMRNLAGPLRSIEVDGNRVRIQGPASLTLSGTLAGDSLSGEFEAQGGRSTGRFQLIRVASVDFTSLRHLQGAYRFPDGRMLMVERAPFPSALDITDPATGIARVTFAESPTVFAAGPSVLVPYPTQQRFTFEVDGESVIGLMHTRSDGTAEPAERVRTVEQDVNFANGDVTLAGTLLLPPGPGPHPAVVFTHGSGEANREWFWGFGYLLAARGVAVLAYDKRGSGKSTGDWRSASIEDFADDAVAGARWLAARDDIAPQRIGFWGLSEGAWTAPLAGVRFPDTAFVITLSGGGLAPDELELLKTEWELQSAGVPDTEVRAAIELQRARNGFMRTGTGWDLYAALRAQGITKPWYRTPNIDLGGPDTSDNPVWAGRRRSYFYDPIPTLRTLRAPLLAIFGELDAPPAVRANVAAMQAVLSESGHRDFTIDVFANGRHNLLDMSGAAPQEFARLQRFVPGLFETMTSWLETRVGAAAPAAEAVSATAPRTGLLSISPARDE